MNATWWRRNRFWLALLVPLLFLAVVASSFRLVNIYLPWDWTRPIVAHDTRSRFDISYMENMSLIIDIKILIYTIKTIFTGKGLYAS